MPQWSAMARVRLLIVDDSPFCQQMLINALAADPDIEVIDTACDGIEAIAKTAQLKPDVITMDIDMPRMDGIAATDRIMGLTPTPTLILTGDSQKNAQELTNRALAAGALALHLKPSITASDEAWNLARDIKRLAGITVVRHPTGALSPPVSAQSSGLTFEGGVPPAVICIASGMAST
jgi:two-component system chemotaxis response regulator CheB